MPGNGHVIAAPPNPVPKLVDRMALCRLVAWNRSYEKFDAAGTQLSIVSRELARLRCDQLLDRLDSVIGRFLDRAE
jgi:hypothetical protein